MLGKAPDGSAQAELWVGAHPLAPSEALVAQRWVNLLDLIHDRPEETLGRRCIDEFGPRLPFLLKVLAAERPLSLQVHPSVSQAREGYAREEASGLKRRDPRRTYRDRHHKPELLCALTPFVMRSGFRAPHEAAAVLASLGVAGLRPYVARLRAGDLQDVFWSLWDLSFEEKANLVASVASACVGQGGEIGAAGRLAAAFPGDVGVVVALLLNPVTLAPGEALYAPAGRIHAYLHGVGVEVMANSDNVVRAGLTTKHVNLGELEAILDVKPEVVQPEAAVSDASGEAVFVSPAPEFQLSRVVLQAGQSFRARVDGPELLLCIAGEATVGGLRLCRGDAAFVPAEDGSYILEGGQAEIFRTTCGG